MFPNMKIGVIIGVLIVLAVVLVAIFALNTSDEQADEGSTSDENSGGSLLVPVPGEEGEGVEETSVNQEFTVEVTSSGFNPGTLEINQGDKVTWTNKGSVEGWPASAVHPTHTVYPGFDAKRGLKTGESYSFTFDKVGSWGYHDHLNPSTKGTVIVKP